MKKNQKIKAFTLSEMLVVLLITTIVVSMAFMVLRLVQQQMHAIQDNYAVSHQIHDIKQRLWMDFNRNDAIWFDAKTNQLLLNNPVRPQTYRFEDTRTIVENDTLSITIAKKQFYLFGAEVQNGPVDAMKLVIANGKRNHEVFVRKENAATAQMNLMVWDSN
ncbi:MAG: type II secretion system protein [Bacteroidota bacterium]